MSNPLTKTFINEQTAFACGPLFTTEQALRDYFTEAGIREIFGEHCETDAKVLERMADMVVANRWHCNFDEHSEQEAQMSFLKRARLVAVYLPVQPTSASPVIWVTLPLPIVAWARAHDTHYVASWEGWQETDEATATRASEAGVRRVAFPYKNK